MVALHRGRSGINSINLYICSRRRLSSLCFPRASYDFQVLGRGNHDRISDGLWLDGLWLRDGGEHWVSLTMPIVMMKIVEAVQSRYGDLLTTIRRRPIRSARNPADEETCYASS